MKIIKLTESQFKSLLREKIGSLDSSVKEYPGSEVNTAPTVTDEDGEPTFGKQPTTDKFAKTQTIQNYWANAHKGARVMP
jgi:hypothetical protein